MIKAAVLNQRRAGAEASRWRGALLFLCCLASGGLVAVAGLFIALMQFQARMLQADVNFTSGDVVLYAEMDKAMRRERANLGDLLARTDRLKARVIAISDEVDYRIDYICKSLNLSDDKHALCRTFLQTIPFNLAEAPVVEAKADPQDADGIKVASTALQPLVDPDGRLSGILVSNLKLRLELNDGQTELLNLHASSFRDIVSMNIELRLKAQRSFFRANGEVMSRCGRIVHFAQAMNAYRNFNVQDCHIKILEAAYSPLLTAGPEQAAQPAPAAPEPQTVASDPDDADAAIPPSPEDAAANPPAAGPQETDTPPPAAEDGMPEVYAGGEIQEPPAQTLNDARQRNFELVAHYLFYDRVLFGTLNHLLIMPNDTLAFLLVGVCGMLGGLLKLIVAHSKTGRLSRGRDIMTTLLLGLICALIVYALFRAGFLALTTQSSASADDTISPFIIALLALASGFVSDRAIDMFRGWIDSKIGKSDDDDIDRWAFGLASAMGEKAVSSEMLAERLSVSQQLVEDWMIEKTAVDSDYQDRIHIALQTPRRHLFTIDPPQEQGG